MRKVYTFLVIILILTFAIETRITLELADQIYNLTPDDMISCIVVMKTHYPFEKIRSEPARSRINGTRKLLSFRYKYRKLSNSRTRNRRYSEFDKKLNYT